MEKVIEKMLNCCDVCRTYLAHCMIEPRVSKEQLEKNKKEAENFYLQNKDHLDKMLDESFNQV